MRKIELKRLDTNNARISGRDLSIEDLETGKIYITRKNYVDKLFKAVGYRNLNVIKILEDFAGKTVDKVGDLKDLSIFTDEDTDSFIVTKKESIDWVNKLYEYLDNNGYQVIQLRKFDDYYCWDQLWILSPSGTYFSLYIDLYDEAVYCLALDYSPEKGLKGISNEGSYEFSKEDSFDSLTILMSNPIDISYNFDLSQKLSYEEYFKLLKTLGYVKKKRKMLCLTEDGEADLMSGVVGPIDVNLDNYNEMTWIKRVITSPMKTFDDMTEIITANLSHVSFWDLLWFFDINSKETSDFFVLN